MVENFLNSDVGSGSASASASTSCDDYSDSSLETFVGNCSFSHSSTSTCTCTSTTNGSSERSGGCMQRKVGGAHDSQLIKMMESDGGSNIWNLLAEARHDWNEVSFGSCYDHEMMNQSHPVLLEKSNPPPQSRDSSVGLENLCCLLEKTQATGGSFTDQNVLLLIGATGSGKTTTALYLAGTKFHEVAVEGFDHYVPKDFPKPELEAFQVAPGGECVTTTVQSISMQLDGKNIVVADTPGLEDDTESLEMDIVNRLCLSSALRGDRSVKPVLVLNAAGLNDRFRSLSDTLATVIRMMGSDNSYNNQNDKAVDFSGFNYIFTRCNSKESKRIHRKLTSFRNSLLEKSNIDSLFLALLEDIIAKTTPQALFIDPMNDDDHRLVLQRLILT